MHSIEVPSPPKFLLVVVLFLAATSLCGLFIGEYYAKGKKGGSPASSGNNVKKYMLIIPIKKQEEGVDIINQLQKYGVTGTVETKNISTKVKTGYAVMEYFSESVGKIAANALKTHNYKVVVEPAGQDLVTVRVGEIYSYKEKGAALVEELKSKGYIFKVQPYEQDLKKQSLSVALKNVSASLSEQITKEITARGYVVEKQEYK